MPLLLPSNQIPFKRLQQLKINIIYEHRLIYNAHEKNLTRIYEKNKIDNLIKHQNDKSDDFLFKT